MLDIFISLIAKVGALIAIATIIFMVVGFFYVVITGRGNGSSNNPGNSSMWG